MKTEQLHENIIILDFGSQYTQLIARRIREIGVFSIIVPYNSNIEQIRTSQTKGIVLSGGPASVYDQNAPRIMAEIFEAGLPIIGICYGLQLIVDHFSGIVEPARRKEYGRAKLIIRENNTLFQHVAPHSVVWMSHGDKVSQISSDFQSIAQTENSPNAVIKHRDREIYGLQFHPEVEHSEYGKQILQNYCFDICGCQGDWTPGSFIEESVKAIREAVGDQRVICGLSGGVDSSVVAVLLDKAIGDQLHCIFVDTGLLRKNEAKTVEEVFNKHFHINLTCVNKEKLFLNKLLDIENPEEKRKRIGHLFIDVFEEEANKIGHFTYLAQGTLYPDVIESISVKGPSATIKSHHNVGGLPESMKFKLIEPLRELFKDEVRTVGKLLGLPDNIINRHPFPGPGLAVRVPGPVSAEKIKILQEADNIYIEELKKNQLYDKIWQAFAVLLPVRAVGVMGDERTYQFTLSLRAVTSTDGMTANWFEMPYDVLATISNRIINEVTGINRVVYDVSSKPPATIEWE